MKQILHAAALIVFIIGQALAVGPVPSPQSIASGFEIRVTAPGPDAIADEILQQAIDQVASAGGGVVLLGAGDFKLLRHADDETVVMKKTSTP